MSRIVRLLQDPKNPLAIAEHLSRVQTIVDGKLEFGSPQDPRDPASTTVADGAAHNGTLQNLDGAWYSALITATGRTDLTCIHNLFDATLFTPTAGLIPVRWLVWGWSHNGVGGGVATELDLAVWYMGGNITATSIVLAASVNVTAGALTINGGNPLRLDLFFTRAVR